MNLSIEDQAAEILHRYAGHKLTLNRLHSLLVHEVGTGAGTYHELEARLKHSKRKFIMLDRANPFGNTGWSGEVREAYAAALDREGVDLSPIVVLPPSVAPSGPDVVSNLRDTLLALAECGPDEITLSDDVLAALGAITLPDDQSQT